MPDPDHQLEPASPQPQTSKVATWLGRMTLRLMRYPGRQFVGSSKRDRSRRRGGRRFHVRSDDGVVLDAWYSPARPGTVPEGAPKPLPIVFCHGWLEVKEVHFERAWHYNKHGRDVILFDHRSHGKSGGECATFGVREKRDLEAVIKWARHKGFVGDRVITMGFSLGGGTVLQHAAIDDSVAGVVALAPFSDFKRAIRTFRDFIAPWVDEQWLLRGFEQASNEAGFKLDEASAVDGLRETKAPVLIVEAGEDKNLPPYLHTQPLADAKATEDPGDVVLFTVDKANHMTLCHQDWPGLDDAIESFLKSVDASQES